MTSQEKDLVNTIRQGGDPESLADILEGYFNGEPYTIMPETCPECGSPALFSPPIREGQQQVIVCKTCDYRWFPIPVEHQRHPAYDVILKAFKTWTISGNSAPPSNNIFAEETDCYEWLRSRGFDMPSVADHIIESLNEKGLLQ